MPELSNVVVQYECPVIHWGRQELPEGSPHIVYRVRTPRGIVDVSSKDLKEQTGEWDLTGITGHINILVGIRYHADGHTSLYLSETEMAKVRKQHKRYNEWAESQEPLEPLTEELIESLLAEEAERSDSYR